VANRRFKALPLCALRPGVTGDVPLVGMGQSRRFDDVRATSALPLIADVRCEDQHVRKVPEGDMGGPRLYLPIIALSR